MPAVEMPAGFGVDELRLGAVRAGLPEFGPAVTTVLAAMRTPPGEHDPLAVGRPIRRAAIRHAHGVRALGSQFQPRDGPARVETIGDADHRAPVGRPGGLLIETAAREGADDLLRREVHDRETSRLQGQQLPAVGRPGGPRERSVFAQGLGFGAVRAGQHRPTLPTIIVAADGLPAGHRAVEQLPAIAGKERVEVLRLRCVRQVADVGTVGAHRVDVPIAAGRARRERHPAQGPDLGRQPADLRGRHRFRRAEQRQPSAQDQSSCHRVFSLPGRRVAGKSLKKASRRKRIASRGPGRDISSTL